MPCEDRPQFRLENIIQLPGRGDLLLGVGLFARWVEVGNA
jgi:hypothetical protein